MLHWAALLLWHQTGVHLLSDCFGPALIKSFAARSIDELLLAEQEPLDYRWPTCMRCRRLKLQSMQLVMYC